ncbi:hypothetical protein BZA05DRAFT_188518 [Tricharina praecox]|uniref:uncharacterized protein n=1 Tax=Tricharina praecox TaxID=43433 RepID=UPI00221EACC6|nr:uncharacterized protein BZA05DRAFT_188518 [Tricharina praecox]KAI5842818.1 hypothetical protein BZA05DRAFT_188518 [Tricharina praecox]
MLVSFVDETPDVTRNYDSGLSPVGSPPPHSNTPFGAVRQVAIRSLISPSASIASPPSDGGSRGNSAVHSPIDEPTPREFESAYPMEDSFRDGNTSIGRRMETRRLPLSDILIPPPQRGPLISPPPSRKTYDDPMDEDDHEVQRMGWPLGDRRDAVLLRHYITHLGKWYDVHDSKNHFQTVVPLESASNPMLLSAMLALAARHLTHTSDYDPGVAGHYHQVCLKQFIPALESAGRSLEPTFLATALLLRTYEEFDTTQDDAQVGGDYLARASLLFCSPPPQDLPANSLRTACFWIHLRQEITSSFLARRPVSTHHSHLQHVLSHSRSDAYTPANAITLLAADILAFAFSVNGSGSSNSLWERLYTQVADWHALHSPSFHRLYHVPRDSARGQWWPETWVRTIPPPPPSLLPRSLTQETVRTPAPRDSHAVLLPIPPTTGPV